MAAFFEGKENAGLTKYCAWGNCGTTHKLHTKATRQTRKGAKICRHFNSTILCVSRMHNYTVTNHPEPGWPRLVYNSNQVHCISDCWNKFQLLHYGF